jgi:phosphopantetheinyl transferase
MTPDNPASPEIFLLPSLGRWGPVVYTSRPSGQGSREAAAARLLEALAASAPAWREALAWGPLTLETGPLGQPRLKLGGKAGPGLSFSEAGGTLWAALTGQGQVGVDAAPKGDFLPPFPYARTFQPEEWEWAWRHCRGESASAAALLWAAKEAAVKALGVGFHARDPLDLRVVFLTQKRDGLSLTVQTPEAVSAWARPLEDGWLALAVA